MNENNQHDENKRWALMYARRGIRVFPVHPDGKAPVGKLVPNGVKDATTDETKIKDWWGAVPSANIGLATGRVFAIDLDVKDDTDGRDTWNEELKKHETQPEATTAVKTPSGGMHLYFRAPEGVQIKNSVSDVLGKNVDVRGHGGYVIAPPSDIEGAAYEFQNDERVPIADAPFWLIEKVRRDQRKRSDESVSVEEAPDEIAKGSRNDKMTSLAGYFRHKGLNADELNAVLQPLNKSRCNPPLPSDEVRKIAESVARYDPKDATIRTTGSGDVPDPTPDFLEMLKRLLAALYELPKHGPVVVPQLPENESLPAPYGAVVSEMRDLGLVEGKLNRAKLDTMFDGNETYDEIKNPNGFDPTRHEDDPSQLVEWTEAIRAQVTNRELAKDLKNLSNEIIKSEAAPGENVSLVLGRIRDKATVGSSGLVTFQEAAEQARSRLNDWKRGEASEYLRTWPSVDDQIEGFARGQMTVMAGFTSGFKTASLVDLMRRVALRGKDVAIPIFSAEMSAEKLFRRCASNESLVPQSKLRPNRKGESEATERDFQKYEAAIDKLSNLDIRIDEHPNPSFERMLSFCLQIAAEKEIGFVGFDYLEKMNVDAATEEIRVSTIAQNLKALAKRLREAVVVLSQYSRQQNAALYQPKNYYLRYSGKIEQEAETIVHWFSPEYFESRGYDRNEIWRYDPTVDGRIYAVCGKQREGSTGIAEMKVMESTGRFVDKYDEYDPLTPENYQPDENLPF